jgi:hypothetical protein
MKKLSIMLMAALGLGFTACDDYVEPNPAPQTNPQETIVSAENLVVAAGATVETGAVDLDSLNTAKEDAAVLNLVSFEGLPENEAMEFAMQIDGAEDFSSPQEVAVTMVENVAYVAPADWQAAHVAEFGKNPKARETYIRFAAYAVSGAQKVRIGSADLYVGQAMVNVTPFPAPYFIDEVYNLEANGKVVAELKGEKGDVYDNPNFKAAVTIAVDDIIDGETWAWRIVAKNAAEGTERTVFAPNVDFADAEEGVLETNVDGYVPGYGNFPIDGRWIFSFNAETLAFSISEAPAEMNMIGGFCGWSWDNAPSMIRVFGHPGLYWTIQYVKAGEGFKFNASRAWDGGEFGYGSAVGETVVDVVNGGGNFDVTESGWYIFVIDNSTGVPVLSILEPNVYVFGSAAGGSWSASDDWKFQIVGDRDAEWPFVSPEVMASNELRLCIQLPGCEWWQSEFIFYEDGVIDYRADGGDQARIGNPAGRVYLNFVTGKGKVE